jgi:hypothetical protein
VGRFGALFLFSLTNRRVYEEFMAKHNKVKVGDVFTLKCGRKVTVFKYISAAKIHVKFEDGMERVTSANSLREGASPFTRSKTERYNIGSRHLTKNFGVVEVIKREGGEKVTIMFLNTGFVREGIPTESLRIGRLRDYSVRPKNVSNSYKVGDRFCSDLHGWYTIVEYKGCRDITILWDESNTAQKVSSKLISRDNLRDGSRPISKDGVVMPRRYYVYIARVDSEVCYVGHGKKWRFEHCNSGISSSYGLNKLHFEGKDIKVEIYRDDMTKEDATLLEIELIRVLKPACNVALNS